MRPLPLVAAGLMLLSGMAVAQSYDPAPGAIPDAAARRIAGQIADATEYCSWTPEAYAVDCLADQYARIGRALPDEAAYADLRAVIAGTGQSLRGIVRTYGVAADATRMDRPPAGQFATRATRALVPVPADQRRTATNAARRAVTEAATRLLRSAGQSAARRAPFQRIAAAIGTSTKLLLRT